jgi:hypothetical protein
VDAEPQFRSLLFAGFLLPRPATRGVSDVENSNFAALHRVENRISESTDVPAANARLFRFLRQIGVIKKLSDGIVDAVGKISTSEGA